MHTIGKMMDSNNFEDTIKNNFDFQQDKRTVMEWLLLYGKTRECMLTILKLFCDVQGLDYFEQCADIQKIEENIVLPLSQVGIYKEIVVTIHDGEVKSELK